MLQRQEITSPVSLTAANTKVTLTFLVSVDVSRSCDLHIAWPSGKGLTGDNWFTRRSSCWGLVFPHVLCEVDNRIQPGCRRSSAFAAVARRPRRGPASSPRPTPCPRKSASCGKRIERTCESERLIPLPLCFTSSSKQPNGEIYSAAFLISSAVS